MLRAFSKTGLMHHKKAIVQPMFSVQELEETVKARQSYLIQIFDLKDIGPTQIVFSKDTLLDLDDCYVVYSEKGAFW